MPQSQEEILAEELAALPDVPPPGDDWPDPNDDTSCPAEYAHLTFPEIDELLAAQPGPVPEVWPAGCLPRDGCERRCSWRAFVQGR